MQLAVIRDMPTGKEDPITYYCVAMTGNRDRDRDPSVMLFRCDCHRCGEKSNTRERGCLCDYYQKEKAVQLAKATVDGRREKFDED